MRFFIKILPLLLFFFIVGNVLAHEDTAHIIELTHSGFQPQNLEIFDGDVVKFINKDAAPHWPASDLHPTHKIYPEFDPKKPVATGDTWSFQFTRVGTWNMHDHLHPQFTGTITVKPHNDGKTTQNPISPPKKITFSLWERAKILYYQLLIKIFPQKQTDLLKQINTVSLAKRVAASSVDDPEQKLAFWIAVVGQKAIAQDLLTETGGGSLADCHSEAHQIGRITYRLLGAQAFAQGSSDCHSGFYHGALEGLLVDKGTANLPQTMKDLCKKFSTGFGTFECLHGLGHGVMAYANYDLPKALKLCQTLKDSWEQSSCFGGVFMENVVTGLGIGADPTHTTTWLSTDPHYPCNALPDDYHMRFECYQIQTSWIFNLYQWDFDKVAKECLNAKEDMIPVCFRSFGRDSAGRVLRNPVRIAQLCDKVPRTKDYYDQCITGAENVIIEFWGQKLQGQASEFCNQLSGSIKQTCYQNLATRLQDVFENNTQRQVVCKTMEADFQYLCTPYK